MNEIARSESLFPIQQRWMDDDRGMEKDALLQRLASAANSVKRQLDAGVTPSEFARLDKVRRGLEAATEVVAQVWGQYHLA